MDRKGCIENDELLDKALYVKSFDIFTDQEKMRDIFQLRLPPYSQGDLIIRKCQFEIFRNRILSKKPLKYKWLLEIRYVLEVVDRSGRECGMQELYAKAYNRGQSRLEFKKIRDEGPSPTQLGGFVVHLSDFDMIIWAFPNDPVLSNLSDLLSSKEVLRYYPYCNLPSGLDEPSDIIEVTKDIVNYRAARRCLVRYSLKWGDLADPKTFTVFGKMFRDDRGKEIYRRMQVLYARSIGSSDSFLVARPLGYDDEIKTVWQEALQGDPLVSVIGYTNYNHFMEVVAKGIGNFHNCKLYSTDKITITDRFREVKKKATVLAHTFPDFKKIFLSIVDNLEGKMSHLTPIKSRIIHADFSIPQLLACGREVAFFDYDEFAIGDPCQDLVKFIVDLHFRGFDLDLVKLMVAPFLGAYQQHIDWKVPVDRFIWQIQAQCIIEAYIFYTEQKPELKKKLATIVELSRMECVVVDGFNSLRFA